MKRVLLIVTMLGLAAAPAVAGETEGDRDRVFRVLDAAEASEGATLGSAVGTFDRALAKCEAGELESIRHNLAYNREHLADLRRREAARAAYLETFWERVAVYFEALKAEYGHDETNPAYRKAALSLREEYRQREADATADLAHLREEIARTEARLVELVAREKMARLEQDLRGTDLRAPAAEATETPPTPTRADAALTALDGLVRKKTAARVERLAALAAPRSNRRASLDAIAADGPSDEKED